MDSTRHPLCSNAIQAVLKGDVSSWTGLSQPCQVADLSQQFNQRPGNGLGSIGQRKLLFMMFEAEGFSQPIRAWIEEEIVLSLDMPAISLSPHLPTILEGLGEPEAKLDTYLGTVSIVQGEWVYPQRGIALLMHPQSQRLDHIALFPSTTLAEYEAKYRLHLGTRRFPQRR